MKDILRHGIRGTRSALEARNLVREYLQARILGSLQRAGAMIPLTFHGGTALRFLFGLPRYSEDLDFALERSPERYDFRGYLAAIRRELGAERYETSLKVSDQKTVHSAFVRFPGLLWELGLSAHPDEVLAVKLEVDTRPPEGAGLATTVVRRHVLLHLQHHDRASLLAGKLHAVLCRPYAKGRDLYDLLWYRSDPAWPEPNLVLLNNALVQSGWKGEALTIDTWRGAICARIDEIPWDRAVADVTAFLDTTVEASLLTRENVRGLFAPPVENGQEAAQK